MLWALPLALALAVGVGLLLTRVHRRADLVVSRVALSVFGDYVADGSPRTDAQQARMRAAHAGGTHRVYASRTLLYCAVLGIAGSVVGVYLAAGLLAAMEVPAETVRAALPSALGFLAALTRLSAVSPTELFVLLLFFSATVGSGLAFGTHYARWEILDRRAVARAGEIEATLPRTVAFVYALSRSGMSFPAVMTTLAENEAVYGEAATEMAVAVRDMNTFGTDVLTALQRTARRTPSENMEEFAENLASVLGSGRSLPEFLRDQYERYQEEAESQQEQYLELLSTFAEAYVTVLVAGPLFFITILVVVGLVIEDTIPLLRGVVYVGVPLASAAFVLYVDSVTESLQSPGQETVDRGSEPASEFTLSDGGAVSEEWRASRERLAAFDRFRRVLEWAGSPVRTVLRNPGATFLVTVPLGAAWVAVSAGPVTAETGAVEVVRAVDGPVVAATTAALAAYALAYETQKRRTRSVEASVPDFLDRLASINEAGMTVVESIRRVTDSDLGDLTPELVRTWRDIQWGADAESALYRLEARVRSPMVSRSVALITNAMRASGDVAPVLSIAADEARASRRLRRERKQVMLTYLIVIYISFLVFLGIIAALTVAFIPAIEGADIATGASSPPGVSGGITEGLGQVNVAAYELLFFHAAVVQALCSGLIAGQLGEGTVRDGVKHAVILLVLTALGFVGMGLL